MIGFGNPVAGEWGGTEHSLSPSIPRSYLARKWEERKKNFSPFSRLTVERHRVRLEPLVVERHAAEVDAAHLVDEDVERDVSAAVVAPPGALLPLAGRGRSQRERRQPGNQDGRRERRTVEGRDGHAVEVDPAVVVHRGAQIEDAAGVVRGGKRSRSRGGGSSGGGGGGGGGRGGGSEQRGARDRRPVEHEAARLAQRLHRGERRAPHRHGPDPAAAPPARRPSRRRVEPDQDAAAAGAGEGAEDPVGEQVADEREPHRGEGDDGRRRRKVREAGVRRGALRSLAEALEALLLLPLLLLLLLRRGRGGGGGRRRRGRGRGGGGGDLAIAAVLRRRLCFGLGGLEPRPRGDGVCLRRGQKCGADGLKLVTVAADAPLAGVAC